MLQKIKNDFEQKTKMEIENPLNIVNWYPVNHSNCMVQVD